MKIYLTIITLFCASITFAQSTGDLTKDTTLAIQLYEQAIALNDCDTQQVELLEQAIALYEAHPFMPRLIDLKGVLASQLFCSDEERAFKEANAAIAVAKKELGNEEHPMIASVYVALGIYYIDYDTYLAIDYLNKALAFENISDFHFFCGTQYLAYTYRTVGEEYKLEAVLIEFEDRINKNKKVYLNKFEALLNEAKAIYYLGLDNSEKSILYSKEALRLNEKYSNPYDFTFRYSDISGSYADLGNEKLAKYYLEQFILQIDTEGYGVITFYNYYEEVAYMYLDIKDYGNTLKYNQKSIDVLLPYVKDYKEILGEAYNKISITYHRMKKYKEAKKASEESFKYDMNPNNIIHYVGNLFQLELYD
jgi:tetratricopeptide (TPR) repeat protein